ncbi:sensor histidine kinase [Cellulosimicrobium cellulans]|uniref:sensor histidine kinase n=1 Tax=Cellulosimicrobium cellulans TaxID=1710 RepID=UPI0036E1AE94
MADLSGHGSGAQGSDLEVSTDDPGARDGLRIAILVAATNFSLYAVISLAGWAGWGGLQDALAHERNLAGVIGEGIAVVLVNLAYGGVVLAGALWLHASSRGWPARFLIVTAVAAVASVPRILALGALTSTPDSTIYLAAVGLLGLFSGIVGMTTALFAATLVERARAEERRREIEAVRAARAVEELQEEEIRVRRLVFDQLHGTLQYHLVTVTAGLDRVAEQLDAAGERSPARDVHHWAEVLEDIRERDVRSLSHTVLPTGADLGTEAAIDQLLRRLPPQIEASIELGPTYRSLQHEGARMPMAERLVAICTVEEAVTNALKHGRASSVRVHADARPTEDPGRWIFETVVDDDGTGPPQADPVLHGLRRHHDRIAYRGGSLSLGSNPDGGGRLAFTLPFAVEHPE